MRNKSKVCTVITYALQSIPIILIAISLGMDTDLKWGSLRITLCILGLGGLSILISLKMADLLSERVKCNLWIVHLLKFRPLESCLSKIHIQPRFPRINPRVIQRNTQASDKKPWVFSDAIADQLVLALRFVKIFWRNSKHWIAIIAVFIGIEVLYIFFVSGGHWTTWPQTTIKYDLLADAFLQGTTALPIEPSPLLENLQNPYNPAERSDIPVEYDASYFRGKYYLYWGPAPAAITALWKLATNVHVGDEKIAFFSVSIIFIFSSLIVIYLKNKYFSSLPMWLLAISIISLGIAHPMLWVLNWPTIYPAAIASGQAFLLAGLYFAIPVIDTSRRELWRLVLIGFLWALAIGSRLTLVGAVTALSIAIAASMLFDVRTRSELLNVLGKLGAFGLPLLVGIGLLGLYNYVRFENVFETGLRYQLSKLDHQSMLEEGIYFRLEYILPNMVYYLIAPLSYRDTFPFIRPLWNELSNITSLFGRFDIPDEYNVENISGILLSIPTLLFSGYLFRELICGHVKQAMSIHNNSEKANRINQVRFLTNTLVVLLTAGIMAAVPLLFFYWVATRYLLDATPLFLLLAVIGSWFMYSSTRNHSLKRLYTIFLIISVVFLAGIISFLLGVTGAWAIFDDINPSLWIQMTEFFSK